MMQISQLRTWRRAFYTPSRPAAKAPLDRDLGADLNHAFGGNLEIVGGVVGAAREPNKQPVLPARHARFGCELERAPRQEERRRHDVELPAELPGNGERFGHVGLLHEAE